MAGRRALLSQGHPQLWRSSCLRPRTPSFSQQLLKVDSYLADEGLYSSRNILLYPAQKTVMGHWCLELLLLLQKPSNEDASGVFIRPLSEGNKDIICLLGVSDSDGLCHMYLVPGAEVNAVPSHPVRPGSNRK